MRDAGRAARVVFWGTYDKGKPRSRILLRGMRESGLDVIECGWEVWRGVEDKTSIGAWRARARLALRWVLGYPWLMARYLALPRHDIVFIGYLGHLDVLLVWPFAKLRGARIVWDAFVSLYNTVIEDRALFPPRHPIARLLFWWEWLACRAADLILLDTRAHGAYFTERFGLRPGRVDSVFVGVESALFPGRPKPLPETPRRGVTVLFYGQFIPLHGIETIIRAARLSRDDAISWVLIGRGQEEERIRNMLEAQPLERLQWIPWVEYEHLADWIQRSDICLGIFGETRKASMVIPNKVFQILSAGAPLVSRDSPAIRELLEPGLPGVELVPPGDEAALREAVLSLASRLGSLQRPLHRELVGRIEPPVIGERLRELLTGLADTTTGLRGT